MLRCEDALLLVIDIQDVLMPKRDGVAESFVAQCVKLIKCAKTLSIPRLVTEQNPDRLGGTTAAVAEALESAPRIDKMEFGCLANENFRRALENSGRRQLLVCGMETHICVMQTVLAALEAGYEVFVVRDAVASMHETEHEAGLARMKQAGAVIVTTQMTLFELLRAAGTPAFRSMLPLLK
jgi:nicotinamidase-related amidase